MSITRDDGCGSARPSVEPLSSFWFSCFFFFQAEDGIRDHCVTGVQTCALPISLEAGRETALVADRGIVMLVVQDLFEVVEHFGAQAQPLAEAVRAERHDHEFLEIGRASCRERV